MYTTDLYFTLRKYFIYTNKIRLITCSMGNIMRVVTVLHHLYR